MGDDNGLVLGAVFTDLLPDVKGEGLSWTLVIGGSVYGPMLSASRFSSGSYHTGIDCIGLSITPQDFLWLEGELQKFEDAAGRLKAFNLIPDCHIW